MDFLTHIFLPLTVAYVLKRELFETPAHLSLAGFGLLSDFDKFIGYPGLLHSFITLTPICLALLAGERWLRGRVVLSPLIVAFVLSHLLLDFIDGVQSGLYFHSSTLGSASSIQCRRCSVVGRSV